MERVAPELGVSNWSLSRWVRESSASGVLRPVEVEEVIENHSAHRSPRVLIPPRKGAQLVDAG